MSATQRKWDFRSASGECFVIELLAYDEDTLTAIMRVKAQDATSGASAESPVPDFSEEEWKTENQCFLELWHCEVLPEKCKECTRREDDCLRVISKRFGLAQDAEGALVDQNTPGTWRGQ